jgi:hypothetical protein
LGGIAEINLIGEQREVPDENPARNACCALTGLGPVQPTIVAGSFASTKVVRKVRSVAIIRPVKPTIATLALSSVLALFGFSVATRQEPKPENLPYVGVHNPDFIAVSEATFINLGDRVIGLMSGTTAKAYRQADLHHSTERGERRQHDRREPSTELRFQRFHVVRGKSWRFRR